MRRAPVFLAAVAGVLLAAQPAAAAPQTPPANRKCQAKGTAAPQVPWHQRSFDPQRIGVLSRGDGVKVAVVDTGVDATHPQLKGKVQPGQDLLYPGGGPGNWDCMGHGTAVASIIAGGGESGTPFRGYAQAVQIVPYVVSEQNSDKGEAAPGSGAKLAAAVQAAIADKVRVINISLVLYEDDPALRAAVAAAIDADIVVVAATGATSEGTDAPARTPFPAAYPGVIGVGAISASGLRVSTSPIGQWVDLMGPGEQITAAARGGGYAVFNDTGMAAPFVSAAAALVRSRSPNLSAADVAARLFATADPSPGGGGTSTDYGRGVVDAYRAIAEYPVPASAAAPEAVPVYRGETVDPTRHRQIQVAYGAGVAMIALVVIAAASSFWMPRGRRRRWLPGRAAPIPDRVPGEGNRRLFDDLEED